MVVFTSDFWRKYPVKGGYLVAFFLLFQLNLSAQLFPVLVGQRFFDNKGIDVAGKLVRSESGNLWIGSHTRMHEDATQSNIWLLECDSLGDIRREKEIDLPGIEELGGIGLDSTGHLYFCGVTNTLTDPQEKGEAAYTGNMLVGSLDTEADLEWIQSFGGTHFDAAKAMAISGNRGIWVAGVSHSTFHGSRSNGQADLALLKTDDRGDLRLAKNIGTKGADWAQASFACANGDLLLAGVSTSDNGSGHGNGWVLCVSVAGQVRWSRSFPGTAGSQFHGLVQDATGRILAVGAQEFPDGDTDFWYVLLDADGRMLYQKVIKGPTREVFTAVDACADGGFILGGYTQPPMGKPRQNTSGDDFWLMRLNALAEPVWKKNYGGPDDERCTDVMEYRPGVYYALGDKYNRFTRSDSLADQDLWLLRIEEYPCDSIQGSIFVRAKDNRTDRALPTRFRARYSYGDRFLWDFGDGSTSTEEQPLKTYDLSGVYEVKLTIKMNESCSQTVTLPHLLEVW